MKSNNNRKMNEVKSPALDAEGFLKANGLSDEALDRGKASAGAVAFTFSGSI